MDQLLMRARVAEPGSRHVLSIALAALALGLAGCGGGGDEPKSDRAGDVAKEYVHTHANNEEAKCAETLATGVDKRLCDDLGPLATRVNPEAKKTKVTGTTAVVTVTGAATALLDITLVKQGDAWKVKSWKGYAPGRQQPSDSNSGGY
jgi:hypothetical protein